MDVRPIRNTDKDYPCTNCGSPQTSIIREADDPRVKCISCNFTFNGSESIAAKEAGAIPDGPPLLQDPEPEPTTVRESDKPDGGYEEERGPDRDNTETQNPPKVVPRTPSYVFLSKDRQEVEFCTKRDLQKTAIRWTAAGTKYDLYQLISKKAAAKVDIS